MLGIENTLPFGVLVINPRVPLVQKVLKNDIGASALGAIGGMDAGVIPLVLALALYIPFAGDFVVENVYFAVPQIFRRLEQFKNELPVILRLDPWRADPHTDLGGGQVLGLHLLQRLRIARKLRVLLGGGSGLCQLHTDVAGKVFVCRLPALIPICAPRLHIKGAGGRVLENDPLQILYDLRDFVAAAHEGCHKA